MTPDQQRADQELVREQYYDLSLNSGELYVPHASCRAITSALPPAGWASAWFTARWPPIRGRSSWCGTSSIRRSPRPTRSSAKLTLNSVAGSTIYYDTELQNGGNILQIALQGDATGLTTGRYAYSIFY